MPGLEELLQRAGIEEPCEDSCSPAKEGLAQARSELRQSVGRIAVSCRYHLHPRNISSSYIVSSGELGSGMCGTVVRATSQHTGKAYAVKQFQLNDLTTDELDRIKAEILVYLSLDHPHVVRLFDVFESGNFLSLVMECMEGGELSERVDTGNLTDCEACDAARQILLAINYLHQHGIVHRDLKHKNIMLETRGGRHLKVLDFGLSKLGLGTMKTVCGTEAFMAPEMTISNDGYTSKCDLWSLGVIVFHLLTARMPVTGSSSPDIAKQLQGEKEMNPDALDFILSLLQVDPSVRLSSQQALQHPWIKSLQKSADIKPSIIQDLRAFGELSRRQRCCLLVVALSLSTQDRAKVRDYFMILDRDHEGAIDLEEFRAMPALADITDAEFEKHSVRKGSTIGYSEFLAAVIPSHIETSEELLTDAFRRFDQDKGFVALSLLQEVFQDSFEGDGESLDCEKLESSGSSGQVSYESFVACVRSSKRESAAKCCMVT